MKSKQKVAIYHRTNNSNNKASLTEALTNTIGLEPLIFTDFNTGVTIGPALNSLLNHVRSNKVDIIITDCLSRFSRKRSVVDSLLQEFKKYNVQVVLSN